MNAKDDKNISDRNIDENDKSDKEVSSGVKKKHFHAVEHF